VSRRSNRGSRLMYAVTVALLVFVGIGLAAGFLPYALTPLSGSVPIKILGYQVGDRSGIFEKPLSSGYPRQTNVGVIAPKTSTEASTCQVGFSISYRDAKWYLTDSGAVAVRLGFGYARTYPYDARIDQPVECSNTPPAYLLLKWEGSGAFKDLSPYLAEAKQYKTLEASYNYLYDWVSRDLEKYGKQIGNYVDTGLDEGAKEVGVTPDGLIRVRLPDGPVFRVKAYGSGWQEYFTLELWIYLAPPGGAIIKQVVESGNRAVLVPDVRNIWLGQRETTYVIAGQPQRCGGAYSCTITTKVDVFSKSTAGYYTKYEKYTTTKYVLVTGVFSALGATAEAGQPAMVGVPLATSTVNSTQSVTVNLFTTQSSVTTVGQQPVTVYRYGTVTVTAQAQQAAPAYEPRKPLIDYLSDAWRSFLDWLSDAFSFLKFSTVGPELG